MKFSAGFMVVSIIFAVIYGVAFNSVYPLVPVDNAVKALCALGGLATSLLGVGLWKLLTGSR
jgi:hypothetical protein